MNKKLKAAFRTEEILIEQLLVKTLLKNCESILDKDICHVIKESTLV